MTYQDRSADWGALVAAALREELARRAEAERRARAAEAGLLEARAALVELAAEVAGG